MICLGARVQLDEFFGRVLEGPAAREGQRQVLVKWELDESQEWVNVDALASSAYIVVEPGTKVRIRKGTRYHSMKDGNFHVAGRAYTVEQHGRSGEYEDCVCWPGSGRYWNRARKCDVEILGG